MFLIVKKFGIQNTSFKPLKTQEIFNRLQSEDSPHKSGIKTSSTTCGARSGSRKTRPTNRGLRRFPVLLWQTLIGRKTRPTNRGLRLGCQYPPNKPLCRKTRPTNRGLRQIRRQLINFNLMSEDSPHKSGIKTD